MKFGKIGHVGIVVRDLAAAKEHYSRLLGIDKWYELVYDTPLDMTYHGEKRNCNVTLYFGGKGTHRHRAHLSAGGREHLHHLP